MGPIDDNLKLLTIFATLSTISIVMIFFINISIFHLNLRRTNLVHEYQLIGIESKKVYVKGKSKADCFRKLQKRHPYFIEKSERKRTIEKLYPEALVVVRWLSG